jgi:hypothetical protein
MALLRLVPPGVIVAVLLVLITSQFFFAFLPFRRRAYIPILVLTTIGFGLGQLWDYVGLPSLRLGQANIVPAIFFALALQPLARFIRRRPRQTKEPDRSRAGQEPRS